MKQFGHWMLQLDHDTDQFVAILSGNGIHHVCVLYHSKPIPSPLLPYYESMLSLVSLSDLLSLPSKSMLPL